MSPWLECPPDILAWAEMSPSGLKCPPSQFFSLRFVKGMYWKLKLRETIRLAMRLRYETPLHTTLHGCRNCEIATHSSVIINSPPQFPRSQDSGRYAFALSRGCAKGNGLATTSAVHVKAIIRRWIHTIRGHMFDVWPNSGWIAVSEPRHCRGTFHPRLPTGLKCPRGTFQGGGREGGG